MGVCHHPDDELSEDSGTWSCSSECNLLEVLEVSFTVYCFRFPDDPVK